MRIKDEHKQEAIIQATIKLINEIGLYATSVSKIAKEANVSPATIYIYYKNKEDLLVSTYTFIKQKFGKAVSSNINESLPIRDILKGIWYKLFEYNMKNRSFFQFAEQFSNSPYIDLVDHKKVEEGFEPVIKIINRGIEQKIIKDVNFDILIAFMFFPAMILSNPRHCKHVKLDEKTIETSFNLAWDAIKL